MNEEERIELKHLTIKCPVCGNTDFIRIKKANSGWLSWDVESETEVYGCTKCYYLMHFCKTAVLQMLGIQDDREKIQNEINDCKKEMESLEIEEAALSESLLKLESEANSYSVAPLSLMEEIEKTKNELDLNIRWRIKLFKQEIERLERGDESNEYFPPYNHYNIQNTYF